MTRTLIRFLADRRFPVNSAWRLLVIGGLGLALGACGVAPTADRQTDSTPPVQKTGDSRKLVPDEAAAQERAAATPLPPASAEQHWILFPPRMTGVDAQGKDKLRACAEYLKQNPKKTVTLIGYSDNQGSKSYNLALTEQRIAAVSSALRAFGTEPGQIRRNRSQSVQAGAAACRNDECRRQMRRVEFVCEN